LELIREAAALRGRVDERRSMGATVGLVPTMGALHDGHVSLIRKARLERELVVVTVFVNPKQFTQSLDFDRYPRDEQADLVTCSRIGVDLVWAPPVEEMYPPGEQPARFDPGHVAATFEGSARPGHFEGVLGAVKRIFDVTGKSTAYFGQKDAQQLFIVRKMVQELELPVDVVPCQTVREPDGLAMSSRNSLLGPEERDQATCLFLGLSEAAEAARSGERDVAALNALMAREIGATPLAQLDYAAVVDDSTFEPVASLRTGERDRAIVAARFPDARLIDNLLLPEPG
jgi:pantoate--beta-alanine ligase